MSKCVECGREMHPLDASQYMECGLCRRAGKRSPPVRNMSRRGTEHVGRPARSAGVVGEQSDIERVQDDE